MRRVVVTGLGMVTPLACGVEKTWERLLAGQSGAGPITRFDASNVVTQYACEIPMGDGTDGTFNPDDWMEPKDRRKVDDFILYGMAAAVQAVRDSGWEPVTEEDRCATGVMLGSGIGGLSSIAETAVLIKEKGPKRVSPFFIPGVFNFSSRSATSVFKASKRACVVASKSSSDLIEFYYNTKTSMHKIANMMGFSCKGVISRLINGNYTYNFKQQNVNN